MGEEKIIAVDVGGVPHSINKNHKPRFNVFAKKEQDRCWVLSNQNGDLFNPLESMGSITQQNPKHSTRHCRLISCSQKCYEQYITFLKTKNRTPLMIAQRRFRHDFRAI